MLARRLITTGFPLTRRALALNLPSTPLMATRLLSKKYDEDKMATINELPTMDELPVPSGSWQEYYDNNQRNYNIILLFGVGTFVITMFVGFQIDCFNLYITYPDEPAPRKPVNSD